MPRIQVYQSQVNAPSFNPSKRYTPALTGAGLADIAQGTGQLGNAITKAVETNELSKLSANASGTMADLSKQWEQTKLNADPNATDTADKFMADEVQPAMDKLSDGLSTRGAKLQAQQMSARIKGDLLVRSNSDMAGIAGETAKANYLSTVENLAGTTITDPTALGSVLDMHEQALNGLKGKLNAGQIDLLRIQGNAQISRSAAEGMIDTNAPQFLKDAKAGKYDGLMKGTQMGTLIHQAETRIRANEAEAKANTLLNKQLAEQHSKDVTNGFVSGLMDENGKFIGSQGDLGKLIMRKDVTEENKSAALSMFTRLTEDAGKDNTKTDPSVVNQMTQDIYSGKANEDDVAMAIASGKVKADKVNELMGFATEHKTPEGEAIHGAWGDIQAKLKGTYTPNDAIPDPAGQDLISQNMTILRMRYQEGLSQGKSKISMLLPGSKDYIAGDIKKPSRQEISARIMQQQKTGTYTIPAPAGQAAPTESKGGDRQPGESAADYLKRKG